MIKSTDLFWRHTFFFFQMRKEIRPEAINLFLGGFCLFVCFHTYVCVCIYIHMTLCGYMHIEFTSDFAIILILILDFNMVPLHIPTNSQCILQSHQFCNRFIFQIFYVLNHSYLKDHISFHYLSDWLLYKSSVVNKVQEECIMFLTLYKIGFPRYKGK